ncbi:MAG: mannose-1-phosphate guanylyltransferase [Victivallaceae bacterium]|nr:mannose-1-phosphate guanylyltransferase [Victivallaceae bacterium]
MNLYAVIMAGGRGERFWPLGRKNMPKQLLKLTGTSTMIEETVLRLFPLVRPDRVIVITNKSYVDQVRDVLPIPPENVIGEPEGRNTAPCVALAAGLIRRRENGSDATMLVLPADHAIKPAKALQRVFADAVTVAQSGALVTVGIVPSEPSTGYGYIHCGSAIDTGLDTRFFRALGFREKPDLITAKRFIATGNFKWNSGMFIWRVDAIEREFRRQLPGMAEMSDRIAAAPDAELDAVIRSEFKKCEKISIDYAVMENAEQIAVAESNFDWDDLGSWSSLRRQFPPDAAGNICRGLTAVKDCANCIVIADKDQLIGAIGLKDTVIVHAGNATMVCPISEVQQVRDLVHLLEERGLDDYF